MPDPVSWPTIAALALIVAAGFIAADLAYHRAVRLFRRIAGWWRFVRQSPVVDETPKVWE